MGRKGTKPKLLMCLMAASAIVTGILGSVPLPVKAADHEARIGDTHYEKLEEAFANAQAGDTITVLKDCSVSGTLEVTLDNITLRSEDTDNPATISRDKEFAGINYSEDTDSVLVAVKGGSFSTQDIILDGGAVLDNDFNNSGETCDSPLIYVVGSYAMGSGTVLQNNYNDGMGESSQTAGALQIQSGGSLTMDGGLIQKCYTSGCGGGVQSERGSRVSAASGIVRNCYAGAWGGGMNLWGEAELTDMTIAGNAAGSTGGGISSRDLLTVTDSLIEGNYSAYDGGGICTETGHTAHIIGCTFTGNIASRGSAIQTMKGEGTLPLVIRDCTFTGNPSAGFSHAGGVICYGNETGIVLSGKIVMEDNLTAGVEPCDIHYFYNTGASILLDEDFESDSTFVLGGYDAIKPGRVLIDGKLYHKDASTEQFVWHNRKYCTEKRGENLFLAEIPEAAITFDADGGKLEGENITAKIGDTITLPTCTKEGYEFAGWYDNDTCAGQAGEDYTVIGDVTLKARYEKKETPEERPEATITFDADGGKLEGGDITAKVGDTITLPACTKEGYEFAGWYDNDTCAGQAGEDYTVTADVTLKARYEKKETPVERPEATITFDADGGKMEGGDVAAKIGDTITLPFCTKEGYEFAGWYDNDTCAGQAGEKYTVTGDVVLKARYEKKAQITYLITFDPNGGRKAEHIRAAKGEKITLPGTEKTGYIFLGWYTEKDGGILLGIAGDELEVTKDMTVYALWEKEKSEETGDKEPETCKAVFHTEGGTLKNETLTIVKGAGLYLPLPEKKGYDFAGWYLDKSLTRFAGTYRDSYRITKDTDFYAKWEKAKEDDSNHDADQGSNAETKDTYTVKYDANGGAVKESSVKVEKGAGVKLPTAERVGFTFKGWFTDKQVFVGKAGNTYKPDQDITLYAKWEKAAAGDSDGNTVDGTDSATKTGTSEAGTGQDKKADTSAEKADGTQTGMTGAETQKEPVLQTGRTSPIYLLAAIGMFGVLLAALSIREGKRSSVK